ncbi:gamma-glutamyltransferase [Oceanithermus sp.]
MHAVAAGHPLTAQTAADVLESGGNAYDAAVAAALVQPVTEPVLASLGGGGLMAVLEPGGKARFYDFFANMPGLGLEKRPVTGLVEVRVDYGGAQSVYHAGAASVAVPGLLRGLLELHAAHGRLPLERLVSLAVRAAREGVPVSRLQAYLFTLIEPILTLTPEARALFAPKGRLLREGELLVNPDYAGFLERLPDEGADALYAGETARELVDYVQTNGGLLTEADLAAQWLVSAPARSDRLGAATLHRSPGPSRGGAAVARLLQSYLEEPPAGEDEAAHYLGLARAMRRVTEGLGLRRGTTHLSIRDPEERILSMTVSNGEGSGLIAPGTGILLNNMLGEDDVLSPGRPLPRPGSRLVSMMAPVILETGTNAYALGSGGSRRIRSAVFQVAAHLLTPGWPLKRAVEAARLHYENGRLEAEPGLPEGAMELLAAEFEINPWPRRDFYFGGVHAASRSGEAVGDPRREGHAVLRRG